MAVIKRILIFVFIIPTLTFGQKNQYPKDTIYIKYEKKTGTKKWNKKFKYKYEGKSGIYFNIEHIKGDMALFYDFRKKTDTLCIKHLKEYKFSNLKEIRKKHNNWIDRKFKNSKYKPYNGYLNSSFITYLIEVISKEEFVIYPVNWRSEGAID
jgi:hypothetical protein